MSKKNDKNTRTYFDDKSSLKCKSLIPERKKYSVIAMNLETEEDVEKVIHQCELIRQEITGGYSSQQSVFSDKVIVEGTHQLHPSGSD
ncbi:hypothetical protein [Butyricimonas faecihominis]|uniref:hypothetical protein n=1 Tax=Butyricimonas faecihominis TaxID=1472416 RepID=UPI0026DC49EA|nr:hypothetical protein [Butyricimonas faecihominis]